MTRMIQSRRMPHGGAFCFSDCNCCALRFFMIDGQLKALRPTFCWDKLNKGII